MYFRFLTLVAFHTYISERVDTAVIECGVGGEYDSTNVIESAAVTGITTLGIDHVAMLGNTIDEIAWHKAGIMKRGVQCFTPNSQAPATKPVMEKVAKERGSILEYTEIHPAIASGEIKLGLQGEFQKTNASLALAMAKTWLQQQGYASTDSFEQKLQRGLETVRWPGRCETRLEPGIRWCIDGGHTLESIDIAGQWFASQLTTPGPPGTRASSFIPPSSRFLIFNQQTRDASSLARALFNTLSTALDDRHPFTHAIFCTNTTFKEGFRPDLISVNTNASDVEALKVQNDLAKTWSMIDPSTRVQVVRTIEEAVALVRDFARVKKNAEHDEGEVTALVTGSLHLVGGFLEVLESPPSRP